MPTTKGIGNALAKELGGPLDSVGKSAGASLGGALKSGLVTAGKVGTASLAAASAGVAALTKQAVSSYADYEQLAGGVETLFKENADRVKAFADEAFRTAGLSANEYMETVTGFSASLLQSLGGDTEAAARLADQAIIDMADNANKMGSDMTSIQNAYQGFAKQNYTMLDNLKLGYGGTQAEMKRLLEDATALSGVEYDINSYADVVEAIHVVQTEMGITGTTAKEAGETVSGSLASLGAAWRNLLTGMADPAADLDGLIDNFVESAGTAAENLVPVIEHALTGAAQVAEKLAPVIAERLPALITELLPPLIRAATALITGLIRALPEIVKALVDQGPAIVKELGNAIIETAPVLLEAAAELIGILLMGLMDGFARLLKLGAELAGKVGDGIKDAARRAFDWGRDLIQNFIDGIKAKLGDLWDSVKDVGQGIKDFLGFSEPKKGPLSDFHTYGPDMMDLMARGIRERSHVVIDEIARSFALENMGLTVPVTAAAGEPLVRHGSAVTPSPQGEGFGGAEALERISGLLGRYLPELANAVMLLDGDTLVARTAERTNSSLGEMEIRRRREGYGYTG